MPKPSRQDQGFDGQVKFDGGMNQLEPAANQFLWGKNIVIRDGHVTTRPGIRRAFKNSGFKEGFYFNEDAAKWNDATHTGFWFPFDFVGTIWNSIQGAEVIRLPVDEFEVLIVVQDGKCYVNNTGVVKEIATSVTLGTDEVINFTQANNFIFMWRGEDLAPLYWDGTATGFIAVPDADTQSNIPNSVDAVYLLSRIWAFRDRSEVGASDVLDFNDWDRVFSVFNLAPGDGDELVALWPFHDDKLIAFKKNRIFGMDGLTGATLSSSLTTQVIDTKRGAVGPDAMVTFGEHVAFMGSGQVYDMIRNEENRMRGIDVPLSWQIPYLMTRISWDDADAIDGIAAVDHDNYLLFAVPFDASGVNTAILVYDLLANGGQGGWCGYWQSGQTKVKKWLKIRGQLYFLGYDGVIREMFVDVPWDSDPDDVFIDTESYDAAKQYYINDLVYNNSTGTDQIYKAVRDSLAVALTDTDYWLLLADPVHAYDIETELVTREYRFDDVTPKITDKTEFLFRHQDPEIDLYVRAEDYQTEQSLFSGIEFSRVEYDIVNTTDWDDTNTNGDFRDPHRKDYTVYWPTGGTMYMDQTGIDFGIWEEHTLRFIARLMNDRAFALRMVSTRGKVSVRSILTAGRLKAFAAKER